MISAAKTSPIVISKGITRYIKLGRKSFKIIINHFEYSLPNKNDKDIDKVWYFPQVG